MEISLNVQGNEEDESEDDDDEEAEPDGGGRRRIWRKDREFSPVVMVNQITAPVTIGENHGDWTPQDYFRQYMNDDNYLLMSENTNIRYHQLHGTQLKTSPTEIKKFIGVSILMGSFNMKRIRLYWSHRTRVPAIADAMTRDRFFLLRNHLKVVDNNAVPGETKN